MMGPCAGGAAYSPAITDLIIMVEKQSYMFLTGPAVIKSVTGEEVDAETLGGSDTHMSISGTAHLAESTEEGALALCEEGERIISEEHLPGWMVGEKDESGAWKGSFIDTIENMEQELIVKALRECSGNQTRAAENLGITRRMLQYKMKKYEIKAKKFLDQR
jgi:DNA-binding NtrC family response regulator